MRRLLMLLCLIGAIAAGGLAAQADEFRFPKTGKHAFHVTLPKGWRTKMDTRGGMLLIPPAPSQHAMLYISIVVDDKLRGQPESAVATEAAKTAGIEMSDKQDLARISDPKGTTFYKGTAFYGMLPAKRGLAKKAKIVVIRLERNTWAQVWIVTQPGIGAAELAALDRVLNGLTLTNDQ